MIIAVCARHGLGLAPLVRCCTRRTRSTFFRSVTFLDQIVITEPTDRVFGDVSGDVVIEDAGNGRKLTVNNIDGWADTVVWNPYGNEGGD